MPDGMLGEDNKTKRFICLQMEQKMKIVIIKIIATGVSVTDMKPGDIIINMEAR